jgi:hypothetical protein
MARLEALSTEYFVLDPPVAEPTMVVGDAKSTTPRELLLRVEILRLLYGDSEYLRRVQSLAKGVGS